MSEARQFASRSEDSVERTSAGSVRPIGEVLELLKADFPDISISKIRFLESQGLVEPERAPSGYRKFSERDVLRLRWILQQQRDHFLPLKVIKDRLFEQQPPLGSLKNAPAPVGLPQMIAAPFGEHAFDEKNREVNEIKEIRPSATLSRAELVATSGLTEEQLRSLEGFGLVRCERSAQGTWYGQGAVAIARIAARFLRYGVEVRHLRIFKTAAEREADLYRQLTIPIRNQRSVEAREQAARALEELGHLGGAMRSEILRQTIDNP